MQNAKNEVPFVKIEKLIPKSPAEIFRAIGEGRLFLNCSADEESLEIDFKVGGKYRIQFLSYGKQNNGSFLEIVPNQKIVFTWCQKADGNPDTVVTIDLKEKNQQTLLTLTHTGFTDQDLCDAHRGGWTGGLDDLTTEIVKGQLRFVRTYKVSLEKLYETCKNPASFFGRLGELSKGSVDFKVGGLFKLPTKNGEISGKFLEIFPEKRISFLWNSTCAPSAVVDSKVTLNFDVNNEGHARLELIHEGFLSDAQIKGHRRGWDWLLKQLMLDRGNKSRRT